MRLFYNCANLFQIFEIDRVNRTLRVASQKTRMISTLVPYTYLFDKGKETEQDEASKLLDERMLLHCLCK